MNDLEKQLANQPLKTIPAEWRVDILGAAKAQSRSKATAPRFNAPHWLRELLWPCPQAWGVLAALWFVIAVLQFATRDGAPSTVKQVADANIVSVAELRRELAELLGPPTQARERSPADRPRSARPLNYSFA